MAFQAKLNTIATILFIATLTFHFIVESAPGKTVISVGCDGAHFNKTDPFATSLAFIIADLITVTPNTKGFDRFTKSPYNTSVLFGHADCNTTLAPAICADCLQEAANVIQKSCEGITNALTILGDCKIEYQTVRFKA